MRNRIIFDIVLFCAVFFTPWWFVAALAFLGAFFFSSFYEIIAFGALVDFLYGARALAASGMLGILGAVVIFVLATYMKKIVR
ncbi:MAG: hypothetical protein HZB11_01610 [Candidatus Yonathbacteria bacterium]|nr:hypothetical protein [Candidatus Yonathbacteria bacterium]